MQISSKYTGTRLKPYKTTITQRQTTNYAAALGDALPCYLDDSRKDGVIAHPVFPVAVTWPLCTNMGGDLEATDFPKEALLMQVHHTERIRLHKPLTPGLDLTIYGVVAAMLPHRAGTRIIMRYEAVDADGEPVFTEHIGGMLRGVECQDQGASLKGVPKDFDSPKEHAPLQTGEVFASEVLPYIYDGCSDIVFPIHTSPAFAASVGLPGIIVQGTATLALSISKLLEMDAQAAPENILEIGCRFSGMVLPGSTITVRLLDKKAAENGMNYYFDVLGEAGKPVLRKGLMVCKNQ
ncbi:MaoC domain protein dehydratase [Desulfatibacillum aliphaticivorans]|uniref:MaoC domain protein dehydratase n=1 Tax=Desulfatibacillum aliphaticivorans TaxID=218208 RepID=B8FDU7_DESAL|nr:MaoC/PaaZ C-terminal domain-containing protein [Desulfatibacillum aliphaticivorans]ACL06728.1 MaoC domain protein dehydratase [Desulfatibacillum aliphaticivorans]